MKRLGPFLCLLIIAGSNWWMSAQANERQGLFTGLIPTRLFKHSPFTFWIAGDGNNNDPLPPLRLYIRCLNGNTFSNFSIGDFAQWSNTAPIRAEIIQTANLFTEPYQSCEVVASHLYTGSIIDTVPVTLVDEKAVSNSMSIFIQMDKPAYKPGETLRVRIVTLDERNLPTISIPLSLIIKDAKNITMDTQKALERNEKGIRRYELKLANRLNLGPWTLSVKSGDLKEVRTFVVEKYVLPKFLVKVTLTPNYLIAGRTESFTAGIQASYTYGKTMAGNSSIIIYPSGNRPKEGQGNPKTGDLTNGQMFHQFTAPPTSGSYIIEANVSESKTGRWAVGKATLQIYNTEPFKITWLNPVKTFHPGVPLEIQIAISTVDNLPASDSSPFALSIVNKHNTKKGIEDIEKHFSSIPANGIVNFPIKCPSDSRTTFQSLTVNYKSVSLNLQLPRVFKSTSKLNFRITPSKANSHEIVRGQSYNFQIETNLYFSHRVVNYVLYDGVKIIDFQVNTHLFSLLANVGFYSSTQITVNKATEFDFYRTVGNGNLLTLEKRGNDNLLDTGNKWEIIRKTETDYFNEPKFKFPILHSLHK